MRYLEKFNESIISRFKDFLVKKDNKDNEPESEIKLSDIIPDRRKNVGKKYDPRECLNMRYVYSKKTSPENCTCIVCKP